MQNSDFEYDYTINPVSIDSLTLQIQQSSIITALDYITSLGSSVSIFFKAALSSEDLTNLNAIVAAHNGVPLPQNQAQNVVVTNQATVAVMYDAPFDSKNMIINGVSNSLYVRYTGIQQVLTQGVNTIQFTVPYPWIKLLGLECINCEALDTANLEVLDTPTGTYSKVPNAVLNQFGFNVNLPKDFYRRDSTYDADLYQGMIIQVIYNSMSAKTVGFNFIVHQVI